MIYCGQGYIKIVASQLNTNSDKKQTKIILTV